jgi:hypothetical protein
MSAAEVARLVLIAARIAVVIIPTFVAFFVVRGFTYGLAPNAINMDFASLLVGGACALAVLRFCFVLVSPRE